MTRSWLWIGGLLLAAAVALGLLLRGDAGGGPSVLSRGPDGWRAAEAYLRATGARTERLDRPIADLESDADLLVLGFPFQRRLSADDARALARWVADGGTALVAYSSGIVPGGSEVLLLSTFGIETVSAESDLPLTPWGWRRAVGRDRKPTPTGPLAGTGPPALRLQRWWPGGGGRRLLESAEGEPVASVVRHHQGRLILLPAALFANSRVARAGNADLLASLAAWLGERWLFDEYHHGKIAPEVVAATPSGAPFDLFALHLGALYLLGMLALGRRFGPARRAPLVRSASTASFLIGLGSLHHRLGHHARAAELLPRRAAELDSRLGEPGPDELPGGPVDGAQLTRVAQRTAGRQRPGQGRS